MIYQNISKKYFAWLYNHAGKFKKTILIILVLNILAVASSLLFVQVTKIFMEAVEKGESFSFVLLVVSLATIKTFNIFFSQFKSYLCEKKIFFMNNELSLKFFKELFSGGISYDAKIHSGDSLSRITTDVFSVSGCLIGTFPELLYAFIQLIATCIYLGLIDPALTLVIILIMSVNIMFGQSYAKKLLPISREIRICDSKAHQFMQEHLQHRELIVTLEKTEFIWERLKSLQNKIYEKIVAVTKLNVLAMSLIDGALNISYIVIFTWGIYGIQNGTFTYAELVVFLQLAEQIQIPFIQFNHQYPLLISAMASVERLMEIENLPKEDTTNFIKFSVPAGIEFSNVDFRYKEDSRLIYHNFSHNFKPCSITAILGETGAGKSTLLRLLLATLTPNNGTINFYGGGESYPASPQTRCNCVYVPQGNSLISGTIRYNLLLGKVDATDDEMKQALYSAAADFVFKDFPDGLNTAIGEGGLGISEGQAQRIAIARSFLRPGKIILMDEPTSALDAETEKNFLTRLTNQTQDKTIIIVTHKQEVCKYVSEVITIELLRDLDMYKKVY
jgi:ABC-type bacteriocin/lantibiotic exporter with double-glycine peptidase domain